VDQQPIQQKWWFRGSVGLLTLACGIALFAVAGLGIRTFTSALIAFLCLMGLERLITGLLGLILVLLRSRRPGSAYATRPGLRAPGYAPRATRPGLFAVRLIRFEQPQLLRIARRAPQFALALQIRQRLLRIQDHPTPLG
jgi:hypothetical protein